MSNYQGNWKTDGLSLMNPLLRLRASSKAWNFSRADCPRLGTFCEMGAGCGMRDTGYVARRSHEGRRRGEIRDAWSNRTAGVLARMCAGIAEETKRFRSLSLSLSRSLSGNRQGLRQGSRRGYKRQMGLSLLLGHYVL